MVWVARLLGSLVHLKPYMPPFVLERKRSFLAEAEHCAEGLSNKLVLVREGHEGLSIRHQVQRALGAHERPWGRHPFVAKK